MKRFLKQLKENKKGFTLIEMIVVIAIIGILAAILVPSVSGYLSTAKESKKEANARAVYTAAQAAVTSLETTKDAVAGDTYSKTGDSYPTNKKLFKKIEDFIGKSNNKKFSEIIVTVDANGAVVGVQVEDSSGEVEYPQDYKVPDPSA